MEQARMSERDGADLRGELERALREGERFAELFMGAPVPYLVTDANGVILEANRAATAMLQVPLPEVRGRSLADFVGDPQDLRTRLSRLLAPESSGPWETEVTPRGGGLLLTEILASSASDPADGTPQIWWILRDVRDERASREREREIQREAVTRAALERVAERARFLSEASGQLVGVLDVQSVWDTAAALFARHAAGVALLERLDEHRVRVRAAGGEEAFRSELLPLVGTVVDLAADRTGDWRLPLAHLRSTLVRVAPRMVPAASQGPAPHGGALLIPLRAEHPVSGVVVAWLPPDRRPNEEMLMHQHLADRVSLALEAATLYEEVVRARRRAEEATAAEADFLAMVSHELRTPLTAIVSYAELLEGFAGDLPPKLARYARQIAGAAKHQRQLVEQILNYKQVQREGEDALEEEELDFRDVVQFSVAMVRPQAAGRPVEVATEVPATPMMGLCDSGKLRQVLANLLSNAIRHTSVGHVVVRLGQEEGDVVLEVEDTGDGIQPEDLPRIYDRFWRGPSADEEAGGSGLGLTITRDLVARMGGSIDVVSEAGRGTTFTVRLPRRAPPRRTDSAPTP
jgi:PAS domain S-box-containing protein